MNLKEKNFNLAQSLNELQEGYNRLLKQKDAALAAAYDSIWREEQSSDRIKQLEAEVLSLQSKLTGIEMDFYVEDITEEN